jgi:hypothetical protein
MGIPATPPPRLVCDISCLFWWQALQETINNSSPPARKKVHAVKLLHHGLGEGEENEATGGSTATSMEKGQAALLTCSVTGVPLEDDCVEIRPITRLVKECSVFAF